MMSNSGFSSFSFLVILLFFTPLTFSYLPVVFIHGCVVDVPGPLYWFPFDEWIQQAHPGTVTYPLKFYSGLGTYKPLWEQVEAVDQLIQALKSEHGFDKFHLVSHSQGGTVARGYLEKVSDHGVQNWVSLAGPLAGDYGLPSSWPKFLDFMSGWTLEEVSKFFLSNEGQKISTANFWKDPLMLKRYLETNKYLAVLNNETCLNVTQSRIFKKNFLAMQGKVVLVGSPADNMLRPWDTSLFAFWKDDSLTEVLPMEKQGFYMMDSFGLKTMNEDGRVLRRIEEGVLHMDFVLNQTVFERDVLPFLT